MKKLALVLMLLILPFTVQAEDYIEETTLLCTWPDGRIESFVKGDSYRSPIDLSDTWIVTNIVQYPAVIRVNLEAPNRKKYIDFNSGWPCRIEREYTFTNHEEIQPESDSFNPVD